MTNKEIGCLAQSLEDYFYCFKDYTMFDFDLSDEEIKNSIEQRKVDLTSIESIDEIIFNVNDCNKNLDSSHNVEADVLVRSLQEQRAFLVKNAEKRMVSDTKYEVKHAIHIGDKEILFAEDKTAENGMCWFVGDYTQNDIIGQYADCVACDDYLEAMQLFTGRVTTQIEAIKSEINQSKTPCEVFTAEQCYHNDYSQSIDGKIVAIKAEVLRPEYRRGEVQLVLVGGGNGAKANPRGNAVFCYHLNDGKHTRFERYDIQGEVRPERLPAWAKEKAAAILAEKANPPQKKPKDREDR